MLRSLLNHLRGFLLPESLENGTAQAVSPIEILIEIQNKLARLADRLDIDADAAPYPHVAASLRRIAAEKRRDAATLKNKIESLGAAVKPPSAVAVSGKNHWERLTHDLREQTDLIDFLLVKEPVVSARMADTGTFLRRLAAAQSAHRQTLIELTARADPQAQQT